MRITHLPAADRIAVPWKNGGGVTRELAAYPPDVGMANFLWRLSMAEVATAGPFSVFPEADRVLIVLAGILRLDVAGEEATLSPDTAPFAFAGDIPSYGEPIGEPVTDLNVMTRRSRYRSSVRRVSGSVVLSGETAFVVAEHSVALPEFRLDRHDALRLDDAADHRLDIGAARLLLVELSEADGTTARDRW